MLSSDQEWKDLSILQNTYPYIKDISQFSAVNNIYSDFFRHHQPARVAFQVAALPKGGDIEIEAVAIIGQVQRN